MADHRSVVEIVSVEVSFIVDTMLGSIARWLRMLGYDTLYYNDLEDWRIISIALRDNRVIITRDRGLYAKCIKNNLKCLLLEEEPTESRLAKIYREYGIRLYVDLGKSRCPVCNGELAKVSKELVVAKVPKRVYEKNNDFWKCKSCGKVYWIGRHWRGIEDTLKRAREISSSHSKRSSGGSTVGEARSSK